MTRKLLALVFGLSLAVALAAGCNGHHGGSTPSPTPPLVVVSSVSPATGIVGTVVTVSGTNFGATQGSSSVTFGGAPAVSVTSWSSTSIVASVPPGAYPGSRPVAVANAGGTSNTAPFTVVLPTTVYVHDGDSPLTVAALALSATGGLASLAGSPYLAGGTSPGFIGDGSNLFVDQPRRRVYATVNTAVAAFDIDGASGALTPVAGSPFGTNTTANYGVVVSSDGRFVFVAGYGSDAVAALAAPSTGPLTPIAGSPFAGPSGGAPDGLILSHDGKHLFVNQEALDEFVTYAVGANGALLVVDTTQHATTAMYTWARHPTRDQAWITGNSSSILGYSFQPDGHAAAITGSPFAAGLGAGSPAVTRDGSKLFVGSISGGGIAELDIANDGSLTPVSGSPYSAGGDLLDIDVSGDGRFVVSVGQNVSEGVRVYAVATNGALTLLGGGGFTPTGATNPHLEHVRVVP